MLHVGLTGNIASGKSNATHAFAELGAHVIDADVIAHDLLRRGSDTYRKVVEAFGRMILDPEGNIVRRRLGDIVFHNEEKRLLLNSLVHPDVRTEILRRIVALEKEHSGGIVIIDAALMVESGFYKTFDKLIVVHCQPALQIARIVARDGLSLADARARMSAQIPAEEKLKLADYTVDTSGTFRQTRDQIEAIYRELLLEEIRLKNLPES